MFKILKKLLTLSLIISFSNCYAEITESQLKANTEKLDKIVIEAMQKLGVPGATYAVTKNGKIIHTSCFGTTTLGKNEPITKDTLFPLASMSKNVTGFLVGALVEAGKIKFEDKVRKYLPDFFAGNEDVSGKMTIRDLISFRSGFKPYVAEFMLTAGYPKDKIISSLKYFKQFPGSFQKTYSYQNVIFGIVGDVLEKATGEKYEDLVQKYIFDKLNMSNASAIPLKYDQSFFGYFKYRCGRFKDDCKQQGFFKAISGFFKSILGHKNKHATSCHSKYDGKMEILPYSEAVFQVFPATSGVSFSAEDLEKWMAVISGKGSYNGTQIVSPQMFKELTTKATKIVNIKDTDRYFPVDRIERESFGYGVGAFVCQYNDNGKNAHPIIFHTAGMYGTTAFYAADLNDGFSIAIACNYGGNSQTMFAEYVVLTFLDICYNFKKKDWIQFELDEKAKENTDRMREYAEIKERNIGAMAEPENYVGTYTSDIYGDVNITLKNNELFLDNGIKKTKLDHVNRDIFEFPWRNMAPYFDVHAFASFARSNSGKFESLRISCFAEEDTEFKRK